jgi:hypothetical protein
MKRICEFILATSVSDHCHPRIPQSLCYLIFSHFLYIYLYRHNILFSVACTTFYSTYICLLFHFDLVPTKNFLQKLIYSDFRLTFSPVEYYPVIFSIRQHPSDIVNL